MLLVQIMCGRCSVVYADRGDLVNHLKRAGPAADGEFSSGATVCYSYAADGTKLREARTASSTTTTTDYTGNLILENGSRSRLLYDGGYVSVSNIGYHFFITDYLGSVRVVANASGAAEEYNHYYPLGGLIAPYSSTSIQPIKFQSKEWSGEKGAYPLRFWCPALRPCHGPLDLTRPPGGEVLRPFAVSLLWSKSDEVCGSDGDDMVFC